ncbi:MAG: SRPBCC domain-containing protein [bacterium]
MSPADTFVLSTPPDAAVIEIHRWFAAAPEVLWRMYTDPAHLVQFYGSPGCTHPVCEIDLRPGGLWRHTLRVPDGREFPSLSTFLEIDPPHRFVYEWNAVPDPVFGPVLPPKTLNTMEFTAENGGCRVTARIECISVQARDAMVRGGFAIGVRESMARLDDYLPLPTA